MYKIGLSSCGKIINEELFESYRRAGITAMEISMNVEDYDGIDYEAIERLAAGSGIELWSYHLPFDYVRIDLSRRETCESTIRYFEGLIEKASGIGIKRFVVHPSSEPISDADRPERLKCSAESLAVLADVAKKYGAVIAVENLPRTCLGKDSDEIAKLISENDALGVCFDTNHLLSEGQVDFVRRIGNRIITTHVSDYDRTDEKHWLPGEGVSDWQGILKALEDIHYDGIWLYEIGPVCPKTIIRDRDLTCEDFARNANELFENKPITIFSSPVKK